MDLGNNIYNLRKKYNMSQEQLAEKIDVTRQTISNWELGETSPNPEQLKKLSKEFNISIDILIGNGEISNTRNTEIKTISFDRHKFIVRLYRTLGIIWIIAAFESLYNSNYTAFTIDCILAVFWIIFYVLVKNGVIKK